MPRNRKRKGKPLENVRNVKAKDIDAMEDPFFASVDSDEEYDESRLDQPDTKGSDDEDTSDESEEDEHAHETAEERRIRLAKEVLQKYDLDKPLSDSDSEEDDEEDDLLGKRLAKDVLKNKGKYQKQVADKFMTRTIDASCVKLYRGHRLPATCVCSSPDGTVAYTGIGSSMQ